MTTADLTPSWMTNVMIQTFTLSTFNSCQVTCHLAFKWHLLIGYARCCIYKDDFGYHQKLQVDRFLSYGYKVNRLRTSFKKFCGKYIDLFAKYQKSVRNLLNDSFFFILMMWSFSDFHNLQDVLNEVWLLYHDADNAYSIWVPYNGKHIVDLLLIYIMKAWRLPIKLD